MAEPKHLGGGRGLFRYLETTDTKRNKFRIQDSSAAMEPCVWIFTDQKTGEHIGRDVHAALHLNAALVDEFIDALQTWKSRAVPSESPAPSPPDIPEAEANRIFKVSGSFSVCGPCLDGKGGECHHPGCLFWINRAPDLPIRDRFEMNGCTLTEFPWE